MIELTGKYYLYRHVRLDNQQVFYVGIGTKRGNINTDYISAYYRAFTTDSRNNYWNNIVSKTAYEVEIVLESNDKEFIYKKEKEFVKLYGRRDLGEGTLVNVQDGGKCNYRTSALTINKTLRTKKEKGTLSNAKNLLDWINSPNYKNPKARYIYLYSAKNGEFIKGFNSIKECATYLSIKGSVSHIMNACNKRMIYRSEYVFSWLNEGRVIELSKYKLDDAFYQSVVKLCPKTKNILATYKSMADAARQNNSTLRNISDAVLEKGTAAGFYWVRESEAGSITNIRFKKFKAPGIIRKDANGRIEVFSGSRSLAKEMKVHKSSILRAVHNGKPLNGYSIYFCS